MLTLNVKTKCLIPLHLNIFFSAKVKHDRSLYMGFLSSSLLNDVVKYIKDNAFKEIYIDFNDIVSTEDRIFSALSILHNTNSIKVYLVNITKKEIKEKLEIELLDLIGNSTNIILLENGENEINKIKQDYLNGIINEVTSDAKEKCHYLSSSNVFLNKYVSIKDIFKRPNEFKILVFEMVKNIVRKYYTEEDGFKFEYLVSSSLSGSAIATCISSIIEVPTISFHNLGPKYAMHNYEIQNNIKEGKRYLYIYDFICLGTEYRLAKNIIESNGAKFIAGIGVASYAKPKALVRKITNSKRNEKNEIEYDFIEEDRELLKIDSLVYVKDVVNDYKIFMSLEEFKSYTGGMKKHE